MNGVNIILEGDDALKDWIEPYAAERAHVHAGKRAEFKIDHYTSEAAEIRAIYLKNGTARGFPVAMIAARREPGDEPVVIEMTLRLFLGIASAFKARAEYEGVDLG